MKEGDTMLKIRLEYADNRKGLEELEEALKVLEQDLEILYRSKAYANRNSLYKRVYVEVEKKD